MDIHAWTIVHRGPWTIVHTMDNCPLSMSMYTTESSLISQIANLKAGDTSCNNGYGGVSYERYPVHQLQGAEDDVVSAHHHVRTSTLRAPGTAVDGSGHGDVPMCGPLYWSGCLLKLQPGQVPLLLFVQLCDFQSFPGGVTASPSSRATTMVKAGRWSV